MTTSISQSLRTLLFLQFLVGTILSLAVGVIWGFQLGASFAIGSALMIIVMSFWVVYTWLTVTKKSIAWSIGVIVIKYPLLLGSIFFLMRSDWFNSTAAALGIFSFVAAVLALALLQQFKEKENTSGSL